MNNCQAFFAINEDEILHEGANTSLLEDELCYYVVFNSACMGVFCSW
jgi:hypothetical protein